MASLSGFMMSDILYLRCLSVFGSLCGGLYNITRSPRQMQAVYWSCLFASTVSGWGSILLRLPTTAHVSCWYQDTLNTRIRTPMLPVVSQCRPSSLSIELVYDSTPGYGAQGDKIFAGRAGHVQSKCWVFGVLQFRRIYLPDN